MTTEPVPRIGQGRCGCTGDECSCAYASSATVLVEGDGSINDPVGLDIINPRVYVEVSDTATVNLTKTGSGTPANPVHISGTATPASITTQTFTANGTFNVPATASMVNIKAYGGGGGGGGGQTAATNARAGSGGEGGGLSEITFATSEIGSTLDVFVGAEGSQGSTAASGGGTGGNGGTGGDSRVEDAGEVLVYAAGGAGGQSGGNGGSPGNSVQVATMDGGKGAASVLSGSQINAPNTCRAPTGGGAGAGYTAANANIAGTRGGDPLCQGTTGGAVGSGTFGSTGGAAAGGGGGDHGARGGHGGAPGGGGAGGGSSITGSGASGAGGHGGLGQVEITAW